MSEQFNLASAVVEFKTNFAEVADDISQIAKYSKKSFEQMEKQTEQVDKAMGNLQDSMKDVEKSADDMSKSYNRSFRDMISITGMLSASLSGVIGVFRTFGSIVKRVAVMSFRMLQFGIQTAIKAFRALISVIMQLARKLAEVTVFLVSFPITIARSVRYVHKSITDMLDDLTKKFVFLQLDIRHIMQLMQRALLITAGAMGAVTAASAQFEEQFVVIRRVTDMAESSYYNLERRLRSTASEIGRSATELAELASVGGRLGIEGVQNLERFAEVMGKLGVATVLEGEKAATEFARLMTIMGVAQDEMENMASAIVQLGNSFAAFEDEILGMSLQLAGAGDAIGLATHELLGLATAMAAVDIRVERGGSAMSRTMIEIANAVQEGGDALDTFADLAGTTAEEFANMFYDEPIDAIFAFLEGLAEMEELPFQTLENLNLAQIRTRDTILRLIGAQEQLGRALGTSSRAWNEATALQREYDISMQTVMARLRLLRENFMELGRRLGDIYSNQVMDLIDGFTDLIRRIKELDSATFEAMAGLLALTSILVGVTTGLLVTTRAFFTIMTAMTLLARGVVFIATIGVSVYFAAGAFQAFNNILGEGRSPVELMTRLLEGLAEAGRELYDAFVDSKLGQILGDMLENIKTSYRDWVEFATDDHSDLSDQEWIQQISISFVDMVSEIIRHMTSASKSIRELMKEHSLQDAVAIFRSDATDEERSLADAFIELFENAFYLAFIEVPKIFGGLAKDILFPALWEQLTKEDGMFESIAQNMDDLTERINEATDELDMYKVFEGMEVPGSVSRLAKATFDLGRAVGGYFWEGLSQTFDRSGLDDTIINALRTAQDFVRDIDWETDDPITSILPEGDSFANQFVRELLTLTSLIAQSLASALYHQVAWYDIGREIGRGLISLLPGGQQRAEMGTEEAKERAYQEAEDWEWSFDDTSVFDAFADRFGVGEESAFGNWIADWVDRLMGRPEEHLDYKEDSQSLLDRILNWSPFGGEVQAAEPDLFGLDKEGLLQYRQQQEESNGFRSIFGDSHTEALRYLLAIAKAEAGNQGVVGQAGVIATVLNRVISKEFPDTIQEVIREKGQFQPVAEGIFDEYLLKPLSEFANEIEAFDFLDRYGDPTRGAEWFYNPDISSETGGGWFEDELIPRDDTYTQRIKDHVFVGYIKDTAYAIEQALEPLLNTLNNLDFEREHLQGSYMALSKGGILNGYGGGDRIPALLEQGEAVIPKEAVKGGIPAIVSWLKGAGVPQYQEGLIPFNIRDASAGVSAFFEDTIFENVFDNLLGMIDDLNQSIDSIADAIYFVGDLLLDGLKIVFQSIIDFAEIIFNLNEDQVETLENLAERTINKLDEILRGQRDQRPEDSPLYQHRLQEIYYGVHMPGEPPEEEIMKPIGLLEGIGIAIAPIISAFEDELSDEIEMLSEFGAGVAETFRLIKQTELGQKFSNWIAESDHGFAIFLDNLRTLPGIIRERFTEGLNFLADRFGDFDSENPMGEVFASLNPMIGAIMEIAQESKVFELIMESAGEIISAFIDMIGMLLEPLLPLIRVLEMALVPIFNALGQILAAVFMPILRMLFPVIKTFGIILVTVAQIVGTVWNALLSLISTIPFIDLSSYKIDTEALSEARQDLIDVTWDELRAKEDLEEKTKDLTESLKNVPDGFAIAFRRFQSAIGIGAKGEDANLAELKYQSGLINDQTGAIKTEQDLLIEQNQILRDGFGLEEEEKDSMFKQPSEDLSALGRIGWGALNPISAIGNFFGLAKGGIATSATKAVIGEAGPEAVIPLDRLDNMLSGTGGGNGTIVIVEGDVYGLKDFERKVQSVMGKYDRDTKGKKYGVGTRRGRR